MIKSILNVSAVGNKKSLQQKSSNDDFINSIMQNPIGDVSENPIVSSSGKICEQSNNLQKQGGPAISIFFTIQDKAKQICANYMKKIREFSTELEAVKGNPNLSKEEIESKVKDIQSKIARIQEEGDAKLKVLSIILDKAPKLNQAMQNMLQNGVDTNELSSLFSKLVEGIDVNPSNVDASKTDKLEQKTKELNLGSVLKPDNIQKMKDETKAKIQSLEHNGNGTDKNNTKDNQKTSLQRSALTLSLETLEEILSSIKK